MKCMMVAVLREKNSLPLVCELRNSEASGGQEKKETFLGCIQKKIAISHIQGTGHQGNGFLKKKKQTKKTQEKDTMLSRQEVLFCTGGGWQGLMWWKFFCLKESKYSQFSIV